MTEKLELYKQGLTHFGQKEHAEAEAKYRAALELDPDWTDCLHALAMSLSEQGKQDEAIAVGQRIVELDPEDPFAHTSLSMFYQRKAYMVDEDQRQALIEEAEKEGAKARMVSWKQELKTNPNAPPPADPGGMGVIQ